MPIVDIEIVSSAGTAGASPAAGSLADALGVALHSPPGRTWVRVHTLDASAYAENQAAPSCAELPVFVTVLHAHLPVGEAFNSELHAVTHAVAAWAGRPEDKVHVQYAPAAAGRQAFGGKLVR